MTGGANKYIENIKRKTKKKHDKSSPKQLYMELMFGERKTLWLDVKENT